MIQRFLSLPAHTLHRAIFMLASLALITLNPYIDLLSFEMQALLLGMFVLILGMPHGALDPLLAQRFGADLSSLPKKAGFYLTYLAIAGLSLVFWFVFPVYALLAFLVISIVHFADDWDDTLPRWLRLFAGTALITHPCYFFPEEVETIFSFLTFGADTSRLVDAFMFLEIPVCAVLYTGIAALYFRKPIVGISLIEIVLIHFLAAIFTPLVYFIIYFCGLHSIRHYIDSVADLKAAGFSTSRIISTIEIITIATAVLMGLAFFFSSDISLEQNVIRVVFIALFALTVPHMFLLGWIKMAGQRPYR